MQPASPPVQPDEPRLSALELMQCERPFRASDPELVLLRQRAQRLLREFNTTPPEQHLPRMRMLASLFGALGEDAEVEGPLFVTYGRNVHAGSGLRLGPNCVLEDVGSIGIGDHVRLGAGVQLCAVARPLRAEHRAGDWQQAAHIALRDHVWIGNGSVVNPGVTIGAGTVVGPLSVVMEDLPPGVLAAGNPCRVVREL